MFTGIIEEIGTVRSIRGGGSGVVLDIEASRVLEGTATGDSIAVNGVCLTVIPGSGHFTADAMPETLRRTSLGGLRPGSKVNLERAMACGGRFGGHLDILRYIARKGSVTIDGVSLTVASVSDADGCFTVSLIPHTMASTTLELLRPGSPVNVEVDMLARYVERLLAFGDASAEPVQDKGAAGGGLTEEFLRKYGF